MTISLLLPSSPNTLLLNTNKQADQYYFFQCAGIAAKIQACFTNQYSAILVQLFNTATYDSSSILAAEGTSNI